MSEENQAQAALDVVLAGILGDHHKLAKALAGAGPIAARIVERGQLVNAAKHDETTTANKSYFEQTTAAPAVIRLAEQTLKLLRDVADVGRKVV